MSDECFKISTNKSNGSCFFLNVQRGEGCFTISTRYPDVDESYNPDLQDIDLEAYGIKEIGAIHATEDMLYVLCNRYNPDLNAYVPVNRQMIAFSIGFGVEGLELIGVYNTFDMNDAMYDEIMGPRGATYPECKLIQQTNTSSMGEIALSDGANIFMFHLSPFVSFVGSRYESGHANRWCGDVIPTSNYYIRETGKVECKDTASPRDCNESEDFDSKVDVYYGSTHIGTYPPGTHIITKTGLTTSGELSFRGTANAFSLDNVSMKDTEGVDYVDNGDFSDGLNYWSFGAESGFKNVEGKAVREVVNIYDEFSQYINVVNPPLTLEFDLIVSDDICFEASEYESSTYNVKGIDVNTNEIETDTFSYTSVSDSKVFCSTEDSEDCVDEDKYQKPLIPSTIDDVTLTQYKWIKDTYTIIRGYRPCMTGANTAVKEYSVRDKEMGKLPIDLGEVTTQVYYDGNFLCFGSGGNGKLYCIDTGEGTGRTIDFGDDSEYHGQFNQNKTVSKGVAFSVRRKPGEADAIEQKPM